MDKKIYCSFWSAPRSHRCHARSVGGFAVAKVYGSMPTVHDVLHGMCPLAGRHGLVFLGANAFSASRSLPTASFASRQRSENIWQKSDRAATINTTIRGTGCTRSPNTVEPPGLACVSSAACPRMSSSGAKRPSFRKSRHIFMQKIGTHWDLDARGHSLFMGNALHGAATARRRLQEGALLGVVVHPEFDSPCATRCVAARPQMSE